ncbi:bromodomain adjacent to zinc finger domain protein 2A [Sinocyclocheilus grahami]|uniref:bromodomain adjacent to zinc finger domain protein 2A n=1 Tax=Sinocyclocheilus grahami TaxID=75366 RepID=UPI0007ACFFE2|nr:PREDICTED: bromodomain adjacent to zinc finger domain protein 2A-like [Sinocyclocheilus grahami]
MEANNHFNYGPHSSVSANSGMKHSSGDSLFTNGSSMSFPQQGKNLNGEMNVNGITTAGGSGQPGTLPPSSSYPHMSSHLLPGSMGFDYLWGQSQYNPAMGPVPPHGLLQKPGSQGGIQPQQPQLHFQGHGPYQVNGSMGPSRQSPGAGLQYWGRGNPGQPQGGSSMPMGYNSQSMYGTFPSQGIPASQHHQQPPALQHQSATAHHLQPHSHHHPPQHQQQQQQQQQHYGVMPNGMPYYQHPSHQSQPQAPTQSQAPTQMIPPAAQSFTPPRGSPQHHHMASGGGRSSPHHVPVPMRSPSAVPDSGSPKSREMQVPMNESFKEMDKGFNGVEKSSVPQRLPKTESFPVKPAGPVSPTDYNQGAQHPIVDLEKPVKQRQEMGAAAKELSSSPVSGPPPPLASPPQKTVSGLDSHSPSPSGFALSTALGVGANVSMSPPSPLQTVQGQRPGFSGPSSAEGTPAGLGTPPSMSSPKSSRAPPVVSHNQPVVFSSKTLMHPPTVPAAQPLAEAQGSKSPQVSPTPLSLAASPSVVSAPPALAPLKGPQEASPLTGQSPKHPAASSTPTSVADNVSLPTVSALPSVVAGSPQVAALASSAPPPVVSYSSQASSASLNVSAAPNVSRSFIGSAAQHSDMMANVDVSSHSPGQMSSHGVLRHNFGESHSSLSHDKHEACGSQSKVGNLSTSNKMGTSNNETQAEMHKVQSHSRNLEPAFIVPKEPERDTTATGRKDSNGIRDQAAPRKGESETLNDSFSTDTSLDYPSLAESTYLESSRAEDGSSMMDTFDNSYSLSQTGDQSKFTEESMIDVSRDLQDTSCEEENLNSSMTSTSSTEEASLKDTTSLLDDSLNDTSQNCSSLLSASINASTHSIKGDHILGKENGADTSGGDRRSALSVMTVKALQAVVSGSVEGATTHMSEAHIAMPTKKPRKPRTPKTTVATAEIGSPDSKIKKRKITPDGPKQEKVRRRKKTDDNSTTAVKKRKISKEAKEQDGVPTDTSAPSNAQPHLLIDPMTFVRDLSLTNSESPIVRPKKIWKRKMKEGVNEAKPPKPAKEFSEGKTEEDDDDNGSAAGDTPRRRVATEEQVQFPLQHGWRREIRVRRLEDRLKGETWYYSPCGRRMKQFPEVIKFLKRHQDALQGVSREHFSFSPRMPVGDFYEERETPEGMKWFLLANEEVPSMIMAITGRRGRPPNPDKEPRSRGRRARGAPGRRPGRPPKPKMEDLLSKVDARLLKRLEAKEDLTEEEKEKLVKIKKKMKRKARMKRKEDAKNKKIRQEKRKAKLEKAKEQEQDDEDQSQTQSQASESPLSAAEGPKKPGRRKKVAAPPAAEALDLENTVDTKIILHVRAGFGPGVKQLFWDWLHHSHKCVCLSRLKAALMRKTGRPEEELCFEERRRSARVGVAEEESIEESCVLERGSRRKAKEEPKHTEIESPNTCSVAELERQIDKLTKRQVFFRKKLQQSSHSMRAVSLGQDRYRRRYLLLPYMGCVLVEGAEDILASDEVTVSDEPVTYVKVITPVKTEVKAEPPLSPAFAASLPTSPRASQLSPTEADPLPGEASLMSSPRGRGRPRKIKPEVELHLRTAKNRRRRRSSRSAAEDSTLSSPVQDPAQPAFQTPLEQPQDAETESSAPIAASGAGQGEDNSQPEDSMREQAEKRGQWFNLLPKVPCDETSISQPCENTPAPASSPTEDTPAPLDSDPLAPPPPQPPTAQMQTEAAPLPLPKVCSTPAPRAGRRRRRSSGASRAHARASAAKRRGRPPSNLFQEVELKYFTQLVVKPIPLEMVKGWWWIKEPEELTGILSALHPRGIREKVLHKHLAKHMEYMSEVCTRPVSDPIFQMTVEDGHALLEASKQAWSEQERVLQLDINVLQCVEDLEQRVVGADLQLKVAFPNAESESEASQESSSSQFQMYTPPEADSTRDDLQYYEHEIDPKDDWIVKTKKEWSDLLRAPSNPLDLAVLRLTNLERNIERRYLKEPLWTLSEVVRLAPLTPPPGGEEVPLDAVSLESEITPRLRTWRQALDRCRSASQLSLCLLQLEKAIAWERSVIKVTCQVCRKGDDDEYLLLCDGCDRGCHMFCLRPKVMQVPEGDWFCPTCVAKESGESPRSQRSSRKRSKVQKRRLAEDSSDEDDGYRRGMTTRQKDTAASSSGTSISPSKRRRMATRNQPDLTYCEIILMEMEAHSDAWPFLEPVNPRLVPGYRRIIKTPMDFLTMRERLLQGGYCSCEEFAADAQLIFNNCELFNEDTSEVGKAGHSMRRFFESRWAEFYDNKDK